MTSPSVPDTEQTILEVIQALRDNPEKYAAFRRALNEAGTDEAERVRTLLHFATSEQELAALVPANLRKGDGDGEVEALLPITTVTVTTVFVACSAY